MSEDTPDPADPPVLLLVDGSSYLYRAYHAMPNLTGPGGIPTGAIHGFIAMLKRLRADVGAQHAACVFDAKGKTFRDDWYPQYKANRSPMPEPLVQQIEPIHEAVRLLGWPVLVPPGIEADDAIGTLAQRAAQSGYRVVISTGDKDLAQLVNDRVTLINTMSNETLDVAGVTAKFGVPPERIVDYLALVGDTVDNVPGVDKVGPKTAVKWLTEHGSLDGVVAAADKIGGAVGANLKQALDWLPMAKKLVTVVTDCDLSQQVNGWPALDALALHDVDATALLDFYDRYGFRAFKRELEAGADAPPAPAAPGAPAATTAAPSAQGAKPAGSYETILTQERLDHWLAKLRSARPGGAGHRDHLARGHGRAHRRHLVCRRARRSGLCAAGARLWRRARATEPGRGAGPAQALARRRDGGQGRPTHQVRHPCVGQPRHCAWRGYRHDTLLQSYVLEAHLPHSLEKLAERHLGRKGLSYEDLCGKGANQIPFAQVEVGKAAEYSGEDSEMTLAVHQMLWPQLEAEPALRFVYEQIEMPTSALLTRIERHGVLIDAALLAAAEPRAGRAHGGARAARRMRSPASPSTSAARSRSARSCSASSACR